MRAWQGNAAASMLAAVLGVGLLTAAGAAAAEGGGGGTDVGGGLCAPGGAAASLATLFIGNATLRTSAGAESEAHLVVDLCHAVSDVPERGHRGWRAAAGFISIFSPRVARGVPVLVCDVAFDTVVEPPRWDGHALRGRVASSHPRRLLAALSVRCSDDSGPTLGAAVAAEVVAEEEAAVGGDGGGGASSFAVRVWVPAPCGRGGGDGVAPAPSHAPRRSTISATDVIVVAVVVVAVVGAAARALRCGAERGATGADTGVEELQTAQERSSPADRRGQLQRDDEEDDESGGGGGGGTWWWRNALNAVARAVHEGRRRGAALLEDDDTGGEEL